MFPTTAHTLPNGLRVLTCEVHSAPIVTCWVWYRVGARDEQSGTTGSSHWVEHMLFKGTPSVSSGSLKRLIARNGGIGNGFTAHDYTAYFTTVPAGRVELALRIEADRMVNARFDPNEVERERAVILAERARHENDPAWWLNAAVLASAFQAHPYRNPVLGAKRDLRALTREDLFRHYQTYYRPNNAVLGLVGDFATNTLMRTVEQAFASLPAGPVSRSIPPEEPAQQAERRVVVQRPSPAQYVQIGYRTPDCRHPDCAPLMVLDAVLSGAKPFSFSTGVETSRSSRLYRALVERQLAASARSVYPQTHDPRLFELRATVQEGHTPDEIEAALLAEVEKIHQDGVSLADVLRAHKQLRAQLAYASERVTSQAWLLGLWEMLNRYTRKETLLDELSAVRADDVRRVAQTYLVARNRTSGALLAEPLSREYGSNP